MEHISTILERVVADIYRAALRNQNKNAHPENEREEEPEHDA